MSSQNNILSKLIALISHEDDTVRELIISTLLKMGFAEINLIESPDNVFARKLLTGRKFDLVVCQEISERCSLRGSQLALWLKNNGNGASDTPFIVLFDDREISDLPVAQVDVNAIYFSLPNEVAKAMSKK